MAWPGTSGSEEDAQWDDKLEIQQLPFLCSFKHQHNSISFLLPWENYL